MLSTTGRGGPSSVATLVVLAGGFCVLAGCGARSQQSVRLDPDAFGNDMGTLISIADVRTVAEEMEQSMNQSAAVAELRRKESPLDVLVGDFRQYTTITNFDKRLFVNRLISNLAGADLDGDYRFLDRDPVATERRLQEEGAVSGGAPPPLRGADWVLEGEVREIFHRSPHPRGGEEEKRTVQYTLRLVRVADGALIWSDSHEIVKKQLIGAVYR